MPKEIWHVSVTTTQGKYVKQVEINVEPEGNKFRLRFAYSPEVIAEVKKFSGAKYDPDNGKSWLINDDERNAFALFIFRTNSIPGITDLKFGSPTPLRDYQVEGYNFLLNRYWAMLAFEMRLGKTITTIKAIEWLWQNDQKTNWWLVAPYGAQQEWKRQLRHFDSFVEFVVITTYESLEKYSDAVKSGELTCPQGVVFDESIKVKNPQALRSKAARDLCVEVRSRTGRLYFLSGAPAPKDPTDWWHQLECLRPGFIAESNIHQFRNRYAIVERVSTSYGVFPKVIGWNTKECALLGKRLAPLVLCKQVKDCASLPERMYEYIECTPTPEIRAVCAALVDIAPTALHALEKSRELSDGFSYNPGEDGYNWIGSPKIDAVKDLLAFYSRDNEGPGRLIIYAAFKATIQQLQLVAESCGYQVIVIDGEQNWNHTDIARFQNTSDIGDSICVIANPACVHGLTLSNSLAIVYYSNNFNVDARIQSERRAEEVGKTMGTRVIDLIHLPIDKKITELLKTRVAIQGITLEEIKKWTIT